MFEIGEVKFGNQCGCSHVRGNRSLLRGLLSCSQIKPKMKDPCVQAFSLYQKRVSKRARRDTDVAEVVRAYATWGNAIPTDDCLAAVASRQPIVELGSGLGYFAHKLSKIGVNITAVDLAPTSSSENHRKGYEQALKCRLPKARAIPRYSSSRSYAVSGREQRLSWHHPADVAPTNRYILFSLDDRLEDHVQRRCHCVRFLG